MNRMKLTNTLGVQNLDNYNPETGGTNNG